MRIYRKSRGEEGLDPNWTIRFKDHTDVSRQFTAGDDEGFAWAIAHNVSSAVKSKRIDLPPEPKVLEFFGDIRNQKYAKKMVKFGVIESKHLRWGKSLDDLVDDWAKWKIGRSKSERAVGQEIVKLARYFEVESVTELDHINSDSLDSFCTKLVGAGLSTQTANGYAKTVKSFTRWMHRSGRTATDILGDFRVKRGGPRQRRRPFQPCELEALCEAACRGQVVHRFTGFQRSMIYLFAAKTGARAGEMSQLRARDLFVHNGSLHIDIKPEYSWKNQYGRRIPVHPMLYEQLGWWAEGLQPETILFPIKPNHVNEMFNHDRVRAGIPLLDDQGYKLVFHSLRHTFSSELIMSGANPKAVSELMGHQSPNITLGVYTHCDRSHVEAVKKLTVPQSTLDAQSTGDTFRKLKLEAQSIGMKFP